MIAKLFNILKRKKDKTKYKRDLKIICTHWNKKVNLELSQGEPIIFSDTFYCYQNNPYTPWKMQLVKKDYNPSTSSLKDNTFNLDLCLFLVVPKLKKQEVSRKTFISALLTMPKPLTVWITINCGKFWKRWEYQTTWPTSWETYMQVRKQ